MGLLTHECSLYTSLYGSMIYYSTCTCRNDCLTGKYVYTTCKIHMKPHLGVIRWHIFHLLASEHKLLITSLILYDPNMFGSSLQAFGNLQLSFLGNICVAFEQSSERSATFRKSSKEMKRYSISMIYVVVKMKFR